MNGHRKFEKYMKYYILLVISIISIIIAHVMSVGIIYGVLSAVLVFSVPLNIIFYLSFKRDSVDTGDGEASRTSFLEEVYDHRGASETGKEIELISNAKNSVKVIGISHQTLWANVEFRKTMIRAGENHVKITSLILDPDGNNLNLKADDEGRYDQDIWKNEIKGKIGRFKKLKKENPTIDLELYTYDIFPIWHMVIIDDKIGLIGYYPTGGSGGDAPLYLIKEDEMSLLTPFIKYFNSIKDNGKRIIPK